MGYVNALGFAQEENMRRRSVDMISGNVREPAKEGPPRSVSARRNANNSTPPPYDDGPAYDDGPVYDDPPSWAPVAKEDSDEPLRKVTGVPWIP